MQSRQNTGERSSAWYRLIQRMPYMPNWIEDAAKRMQEERTRRGQNEKYRETLQNTLSVNSQNVFSILLEAVASDIEKFNNVFSDSRQKLQGPELIGAAGFQVKRSYDPVFVLTVRMDNKPSICWDTVRSSPALGSGLYADSGSFDVQVEETGDGALVRSGAAVSFADAAKELLLPAIEGLV